MKRNLLCKLLVTALVLTMLLPQAALASSVPEGSTCFITVGISSSEGEYKVTATSSKYLTGASPLAIEVITLIQKSYDDLSVFRSPAMKSIMDQGLEAFRTSDAAWDNYLSTHFDDVGGDLKALVSKKTTTLGDLEPEVEYVMTYTNKVADDPAYGTTYTVTITLHVDGYTSGIVNDPSKNGVDRLLTPKHTAYMNGDTAGTFRPDDDLTRCEAAQIFYNLLRDKPADAPHTFEDVAETDWYAPAVNAIAALGIIEGDGQGHFFPGEKITRAQFVAMAARFAKAVDADVSFADVPADHWAYAYIKTAVGYGWIGGYEDNTFRPENPIVRAEVVQIINNMLLRYADKAYVAAHLSSLKTFPDVDRDCWAYYQILEAVNAHDYTRNADGSETWIR